ncbi:hypothetical protein KJ940_15775 [Myxococcota bacterium]|nr:hypothetical protein [Myxococcota bacterium]
MLLCPSAAPAAPLNIHFEPDADALIFRLEAPALRPAQLHVRARGEVIIIQVEETEVRQGWIASPDPMIRRSHARGSRARPGASLLRVRLKRPPPPWMLADRWVRPFEGGLRLGFPKRRAAPPPQAEPAPLRLPEARIGVDQADGGVDQADSGVDEAKDGGVDQATVSDAAAVMADARGRPPIPPQRTPPPIDAAPQGLAFGPLSLLIGGVGGLALLLGLLFIRRRGRLPKGFKIQARTRLPNRHELLVVACEGQHLLLSRARGGAVQILATLDAPLAAEDLEARADALLTQLRAREALSEPEDVRLLNALLHDPPED